MSSVVKESKWFAVFLCGAVTVSCGLTAADGGPEDTESDEDLAVAELKSDSVRVTEWEARGTLRVANGLSEADLVDRAKVGIIRRAARSIVAHRPFETIRALDAAPGVGPKTIARLVSYARVRGWTEEQCEPGQWRVKGTIDRDTTWSTCEVVVEETIRVLPGVTLRVLPGTVVKLGWEVWLGVHGKINATGSSANPIRFTNLSRPWYGIELLGAGEQSFSHVVFEGAYDPLRINNSAAVVTVTDSVLEAGGAAGDAWIGIDIRDEGVATLTVERSLVRGFRTGIKIQNAQNVFVRDSILKDNWTGIGVGGDGHYEECPHPVAALPEPPRPFLGRDPLVEHTDLVGNDVGIAVYDDVVIKIDRCNVSQSKWEGITMSFAELQAGSRISHSNIVGNSLVREPYEKTQLFAFHTKGTLQLVENYFGSAPTVGNGEPNERRFSQTIQIACGGTVEMVGAHATVPWADAGPRWDRLSPLVRAKATANP